MRLLREGHRQHLEMGRPEMAAEGEGFEPPGLSPDRFQDGHHKPLGHPSRCKPICMLTDSRDADESTTPNKILADVAIPCQCAISTP